MMTFEFEPETMETEALTAPAPVEVAEIPLYDDGKLDIMGRVKLAAAEYMKLAEKFPVQAETLLQAGLAVKRMRSMRDLWKSYKQPHIDSAMETKRAAEASRKMHVDELDAYNGPIEKAERRLAGRIVEFEDRLKAEAAEAARLAEVKAQAEAVERQLQAAIEIEAEAATAKTEDERQALEAEVQAVIEQPIICTRAEVFVPSSGLTSVNNWRAEIEDLNVLLRALVADKLPKSLTDELNTRIADAVMPPLNVRARQDRNALNIPGVKATNRKGYRK